MKIQRHAAILRVVRERRIESQDELREALADGGVRGHPGDACRATSASSAWPSWPIPQGGAFYTHPHRAAVRPDLAQVLPALLVSVDGVGPLLVLKTASGSAGAITEALDQAGWAEVIGTIAGRRHRAGDHPKPAAARGDRRPDPGAGEEVTATRCNVALVSESSKPSVAEWNLSIAASCALYDATHPTARSMRRGSSTSVASVSSTGVIPARSNSSR